MMNRKTRAALLALVLFVPNGVSSAHAAVTGTGGGPETTVTAPHTRSSGQTVPSGRLDSGEIGDPTERTDRQRSLDRVLDGICAGCR